MRVAAPALPASPRQQLPPWPNPLRRLQRPAPDTAPEDEPVLPATVTDVNGDEVTVEDVSRIVPLNGEITEVTYALGLGDNVVGVDTRATYPPEAASKPSIGYQRTLSAEGIISLNPTVIIGTEAASPSVGTSATFTDSEARSGLTLV